ncbi:MAG: AraC family transcriptional regulator [Pseudomonadota bacterium]
MHRSIRHKTAISGVDVISIRSDCSFPRHTHDEFGFGYIVDGGQESWSGRGLVEASAGDVIAVNPGEVHDGLGSKGRPRHWRMLFLTPDLVADYAGRPASQIEFHDPVFRKQDTYQLVASAIEVLAFADADPAYIEELVTLALGNLVNETGAGSVPSRHSAAVGAVMDLVRDAWSESLCLEDFSRAAGMSRFRILRAFSKEVGITPHAYLTQHRVKQARRLILDGVPIAEAAIAAGFSDQSHLTRAYSRQFGLTPGRDLRARSD